MINEKAIMQAIGNIAEVAGRTYRVSTAFSRSSHPSSYDSPPSRRKCFLHSESRSNKIMDGSRASKWVDLQRDKRLLVCQHVCLPVAVLVWGGGWKRSVVRTGRYGAPKQAEIFSWALAQAGKWIRDGRR